MKQLKWEDLTVQQFQDIYRLSLATDLDETDKVARAICILHDMTESQVDEMTITRFNELAKQCAFVMKGNIPGRPVRVIRIGRKRYRVNYKPSTLRHRQYVEIIHFSDKPIDNMHLCMASLVEPVTWYGRCLPNKAEDHQVIASDLLQARVIDVYNSCVFFCKLYSSLIDNIAASLIAEMMMAGMTREEAILLLRTSQSAMDGSIQQGKWPPLKLSA